MLSNKQTLSLHKEADICKFERMTVYEIHLASITN